MKYNLRHSELLEKCGVHAVQGETRRDRSEGKGVTDQKDGSNDNGRTDQTEQENCHISKSQEGISATSTSEHKSKDLLNTGNGLSPQALKESSQDAEQTDTAINVPEVTGTPTEDSNACEKDGNQRELPENKGMLRGNEVSVEQPGASDGDRVTGTRDGTTADRSGDSENKFPESEDNNAPLVASDSEPATGDGTTPERSGNSQKKLSESENDKAPSVESGSIGNGTAEQIPPSPIEIQNEVGLPADWNTTPSTGDNGTLTMDAEDDGKRLGKPTQIQEQATGNEDPYKEATSKVKQRLSAAPRKTAGDSIVNSLRFFTRKEELEEYFCSTCSEG